MSPAENYIHFFENLTEESLAEFTNIFTDNARFKDPFNDVNGIANIQKVFQHMFETTLDSKFVVKQYAESDLTLFLYWDYHFKTPKGEPWMIQGTSLVTFDQQGKAIEHIDFWDPAEGIYEKIPVLSWFMKKLKKRLSVS